MADEYTSNVKNYQDVNLYPTDYRWMSQQWGEGILDYFNSYQKQADNYYQKHIDNPDMKSDYLNLYSHVEDQLTGAKNVLSVMGIKVEQWGEGGTWIIAVRSDAEAYNRNLDIEDDTTSGINTQTLWPSPEGNRFTKSSQKTRNLSPKDYSYNEASSATNRLVWDDKNKSWYDPINKVHYHSDGSTGYVSQVTKNGTGTTLPSYSTIGV